MKKGLFIGVVIAIVFLGFFAARKYVRRPERASMEALRSHPYLTWVPAEKSMHKKGVTKCDEELAFKGVNVYNSSNVTEAYLMDMSGTIVHTWSSKAKQRHKLHHVEMCENGDLLAMAKDLMLMRLDWDSNVKWMTYARFHHDLDIAENGDIFALSREDEFISISDREVPILNDYIMVLSSLGDVKKKLSLFEILKDEVPEEKFIELGQWMKKPGIAELIADRRKAGGIIFINDSPPDILHVNTLEIIDRDIEGLCKKGDLLISARELDLIAILDLEREELVWKWGPGNLSAQHHPMLLANGNILIFDNGKKREYSRIVELNPLTEEIEWEYTSDPREDFYSFSRGASQRLPNGNTLITESNKGRVFEVTYDGKIVWEFYTPEILEHEKKRAAIYRMTRIVNPQKYPCLARLKHTLPYLHGNQKPSN